MKKIKILDKLKKIILIILCAITVFFSMPVKSNADIIPDFTDILLFIPDGVMRILNKFVGAEEGVLTEIEVDVEGTASGTNGAMYNFSVTPYDIFTSGMTYTKGNGDESIKLPLLNINFFKKITDSNGNEIKTKTTNSADILRPVVSSVYKSLRNTVLIVMLVVLLYVGIRIIIASAVSDQVKYKQWIMDWVIGICLVVILQYIMSFLMNVNEMVVNMLGGNKEAAYYISFAEMEGAGLSLGDKWEDVAQTNDNKEKIFAQEHLAIADDYFSFNTENATINLNSNPERAQLWGDENGDIFVNARIYKEENYADKAIFRGNVLEYIRSVISFGTKYVREYHISDQTDININESSEADATTPEELGYVILYLLLVVETVMFLYTYLKRVFKLAFYTMIAPLIAFMYPIDKLGDGKAQAFNTWFKEYLYNVLIQPLHLLLYTVFIYSAMELMRESMIYALGAYAYMIAAEKFFKKIFGFDKAPAGGAGGLASGMAGGLAMKGLGGLKGSGSGSKGSGKNGGKDSAHRKIKYAKNSRPTATPTTTSTTGTPGSSGGMGAPGSFGGARGSRSASRGSMTPGASGIPGASGVPGASGGRFSGIGRGIKNSLLDRGARILTAGEARNRSDFSRANFIKGAKTRVGRGLKYGGKKATQLVGAGLGAVGGLAAGAAIGMAASALSGEDKMGEAMQTGALGGAALGASLGGRAFDWGDEQISGIWDDSKKWAASKDGGNNVELAAEMQMEDFAESNQEYFDSMTSDQREELMDGFRCGAKIKDQSDAEQYLAARTAGIDAFTAAEMSSTDDEMSPYGETFRDYVRSNTTISEATDAQKYEAENEAKRIRQQQVDAQKELIRKMQKEQLEEMANARRAHADINSVRDRQRDEMSKANRELRRLQASTYSNNDYENILLENIQKAKIEQQQKFHEKNW